MKYALYNKRLIALGLLYTNENPDHKNHLLKNDSHKTTSPQKLFRSECITLCIEKIVSLKKIGRCIYK